MKLYVSKESRGGDGTKEYPLASLASLVGSEMCIRDREYTENM